MFLKIDVIGQSFRSFNRIGKYLIFGLDDYDLVVHLRMEGKFYLYDKLQMTNIFMSYSN